MNNRELLSNLVKKISGIALDTETCCIRVSGDDAINFLQGQLSSDIESLNNQAYQISSFSTHQGKVIALLRILRDDNDFLILINKAISNYFLEKISIYILASKVTIDIKNNYLVYGLLGDDTKKVLEKLKINLKNGLKKFQNSDIWILNNSTKDYQSLILIGSENDISSIEDLTKEFRLKKATNNILKLLDILNGAIRINDKNKERYIPQVLNVEKLDGISFKKGCYTGQEIIARTHYLGKIKKRAFTVFSKDILLDIDDKIYNKNGESVGEIISENVSVDNFCYNLAVIKIDELNQDLFSKDTPLTIMHPS
tara:strand:+ start:21 stop:956 length:936 start_codon:yes stop_codon:yes gene_type:complete